MADMGHGEMARHDMSSRGSGAAPGAVAVDPHAGHDVSGQKGTAKPEPPKPAAADPQAGHAMPQPPQPPDPHAAHDMSSMTGGVQTHPESERGNPLVDMQAMRPVPRLDDPGVGLRGNGRRVLTYSDLRSVFDDPDGREPGRTIELHLTGHMEKFAWSFDGVKFTDAAPVPFEFGERLRIVLVNDTMMSHPIHLHGMWSDVEDEHGQFMVRKHTVDMPPGTKRSFRVRADALGRWAFHCHLLYHMESGMFREMRVEE
jgi:CopA family copper-resistance protein